MKNDICVGRLDGTIQESDLAGRWIACEEPEKPVLDDECVTFHMRCSRCRIPLFVASLTHPDILLQLGDLAVEYGLWPIMTAMEITRWFAERGDPDALLVLRGVNAHARVD